MEGKDERILLKKADESSVLYSIIVENIALPFINEKLESAHVTSTLPFEHWHEAFGYIGPSALTHKDYY